MWLREEIRGVQNGGEGRGRGGGRDPEARETPILIVWRKRKREEIHSFQSYQVGNTTNWRVLIIRSVPYRVETSCLTARYRPNACLPAHNMHSDNIIHQKHMLRMPPKHRVDLSVRQFNTPKRDVRD